MGPTRFDLPRLATDGAVGLDLPAALEEPLTIEPGGRALVPCGFAIAIPTGFEGQVRARSGLALKHGLTIPNAPGTIDPDYRGEVKVILANGGSEPFTVEPGQRIAQLVVCPVARPVLREVPRLDETPRGDGGFGHTQS